jgi:hypothetical protein
MSQVQNSKVKDPEFTKRYGPMTTFSYGCEQDGSYEEHLCQTVEGEDDVGVKPPCCDVYVYRMTMVNEDGDVVEYSPTQIKERCEQMGVHYVMEFETFVIPEYERTEDRESVHIWHVNAGEYVLRKVEQYFDGPDPIGKTHVREGVVARILNRSNFAVYKHKNFSFKVLEGIAKDEATAPDIEEAQELIK